MLVDAAAWLASPPAPSLTLIYGCSSLAQPRPAPVQGREKTEAFVLPAFLNPSETHMGIHSSQLCNQSYYFNLILKTKNKLITMWSILNNPANSTSDSTFPYYTSTTNDLLGLNISAGELVFDSRLCVVFRVTMLHSAFTPPSLNQQ